MRRFFLLKNFFRSLEIEEDEINNDPISDEQLLNRLRNRKDIFSTEINHTVHFILSFSVVMTITIGTFLSTHEIIEVKTDFLEIFPDERNASRIKNLPEILNIKRTQGIPTGKKKLVPDNRKDVGFQTGGGGDPRTRITKNDILGITSGQIREKNIASADIFGKSGFASGIDAVLSGTGGLQAGGSGGVGRRGTTGIGYGAGYASGFGGSSGGVDDLHASLINNDGGYVSGSVYEGENSPIHTNGEVLHSDTYNTESYNHLIENPFKLAKNEPLSTFSIDVDVASYSNIRRFINSGTLPPPGAVRIEEMINYFSYNYPQPTGRHPFSITTEIGTCPWNKKHKLVHIGIQGKKINAENVKKSNLVFLIDVSGSMQAQNKLLLVKSSLRMLINNLENEDQIAIVVYAGSAGMVLNSTPVGEKRTILQVIDNLRAGGSTAGGEGIELAYAIALNNFINKGNNRVLLATDGDFNIGISSDSELVKLIEKKRAQGIFLTVLGFGTGNYKDSKMEKLADHGNGNYAYIDMIVNKLQCFYK